MSRVHDLAGIGVGPFNLSVAALVDEVPELDAAFLEAEDEFRWHPGMLLPGTRLQTSPLKDLVTGVDPTNPSSFLNYLVDQGRLYPFLHADLPAVSREEFEDYLAWAALRLESVRFGQRVSAVTHDRECFRVHVESKPEPVRARNLVLGTGPSPKVPECARGMLDDRRFHGSTIALRDPDVDGERVAVVGGGQSGAEIVQALLDGHWGTPERVTWLSRRSNFQPLDEVAFTNEHFTPQYVEAYYPLDETKKRTLLEEQKLAADGITPRTLRSLYRQIYEAKALDRGPTTQLLPDREVVNVDGGNLTQLQADNRLTGETERYEADRVVFATGYEYTLPDYLAPIAEDLPHHPEQPLDLEEDFRVLWSGPDDLDIYAVNAGRFSHGIAEPQLSLACWRSARIVNDLVDREVYDLDQGVDMVEWTAPGEEGVNPHLEEELRHLPR